MTNLRRRTYFLGVGLILFLPFCVFVLFSVPDMTNEQLLIQHVSELQVKLQYLDSLYRARQEDLQHLDQIICWSKTNNNNNNNHSSSEDSSKSNNTSITPVPSSSGGGTALLYLTGLQSRSTNINVRFPSVFNFLPHLLDSDTRDSLRPEYLLSRGRTGVGVVMGVPTVRRDKYSYLIHTVQNLIENMNRSEANDALIVVFVADNDLEYVLQTARELESRFSAHIESGLIEVLAPSPNFYPDWERLRITMGDPEKRVRWRSKQNLDYAYLMAYCQSKGTFYVQLEDDILTKPTFLTTMKEFAFQKISRKEPWFLLDFCQLGFIGKLFKTSDLPLVVQFLIAFYNDKPCDWLLDDLITTKICNPNNHTACKKAKGKLWPHYKPSLFQHVGTHSSLKGKIQKLKDKQFGKTVLFHPHQNPAAKVHSTTRHYENHSLERAYLGLDFFWGVSPFAGAKFEFNFTQPFAIKKFLFRSGNAEHTDDMILNATVEVLPFERIFNTSNNQQFPMISNENFIVIGKFDASGLAEGTPDPSIGDIQALRIHLHSDSNNWIILNEINIEERRQSTIS